MTVIIKGGLVYDGSPNPPYPADVKIQGDKIVAVGKLSDEASEIIDASGCIVTPGFIDVHNHADMSFAIIRALGKAEDIPELKGNLNYTYQGVTTIVTGNCGTGYADTSDWFGYLDSLSFGTNVYHLAPHGNIRLELFGAGQPTRLTAQQLQVFKGRVVEEMEKGAIGFSSGLEYAPGWLADVDELTEIGLVVRKYGGVYATHIRNESGKKITESLNEAIEVGRRADIPVQIAHFKLRAPFQASVTIERVLKMMEDARRSGLDITADQYPYDAGATHLTWLLEDKNFLLDEKVKPEFKTPKGKVLIAKSVNKTFKYLPPEKVLISMCPKKTEYEGKTLKQVADLERRDAAEVFTDMVCLDNVPGGIFFNIDPSAVKQIMLQEYVFTGSDGTTLMKGITKSHPRCYAAFTKKLKRFALDEKLIDLNFAVRSMTSLPAEKFKMKGRGKIAEGYFADIAVIDTKSLKDNATYESPDNLSEGVVHLFVNGVKTIDNGKYSGRTGGRALRRQR